MNHLRYVVLSYSVNIHDLGDHYSQTEKFVDYKSHGCSAIVLWNIAS